MLWILLLFFPLSAFGQFTSTARHIGPYASAPAHCSTASGDIYYNTTSKTPFYCSAPDTWTAMGGSGGGSPAGSAGCVQLYATSTTFACDPNFIDNPTFGGGIVTYNGSPGITVTGVSTPSGGSTFYEYYVVATLTNHSRTPGGNVYAFVEDGPVVLDGTHYITLTWSAVPNAASYQIYTDERDGTPSSVGLLGSVAGNVLTFKDDGVMGDGNVVYTASSYIQQNAFGQVYIQSNNPGSAALFMGYLSDGNFSTGISQITAGQVSSSFFGPVPTYSDWYFSTAMNDNAAEFDNIFAGGQVLGGTTQIFRTLAAYAPFVSGGTIATAEAVWVGDYAGVATNAYYSWFDSRGVMRVREDSAYNGTGQAILALYNNAFTKYTPGAVDFERSFMAWDNANRLHFGAQAGGTGTLRGLTFDGASYAFTSVAAGAATGKRVLCIDDTTKIIYESSTGTDCSN